MVLAYQTSKQLIVQGRPEDKYLPVVRTASKPVIKFSKWLPNRNEICQNGKKSFHFDASFGSANRKRPFQGGVMSALHIKCPFQGISSKFPSAHYPSVEHQKPYNKQDDDSTTSCGKEEGTCCLTAGDSLYHTKG